jgi:hypothetical protein
LIDFGISGDLPVIGDWNGDGKSDIGIIRNGKFYLDANGNRVWNNTAGGDASFNFGTTGDKPIAGDWNNDGKFDVGIVRSGTFYLDANGNRAWNNTTGGDSKFTFGSSTDIPIAGLWRLPSPAPSASPQASKSTDILADSTDSKGSGAEVPLEKMLASPATTGYQAASDFRRSYNRVGEKSTNVLDEIYAELGKDFNPISSSSIMAPTYRISLLPQPSSA